MASLPIPTPGQPVRSYMRQFGALITPGLNTRSASGTTHRGPGGTTIYPRASAAFQFPWNQFSLGFTTTLNATTHVTTCTIHAGAVRVHGAATLQWAEAGVELSGTPCWVYLQYTRPAGALSLAIANTEPATEGDTVCLPLFLFDGAPVQPDPEEPAYLIYTLRRACNLGDFNFDTPIK